METPGKSAASRRTVHLIIKRILSLTDHIFDALSEIKAFFGSHYTWINGQLELHDTRLYKLRIYFLNKYHDSHTMILKNINNMQFTRGSDKT